MELQDSKARDMSSPLTSMKSEPDNASDSGENGDIERCLATALRGVGTIRKEIASLRRQNLELKSETDRLHESANVSIQPKRGRRSGMSVQALNARVKKLNNEVARLEKAKERDKRTIQQFKRKEVEQDAEELRHEVINGIDDTADKMRKLLRRFYSVVTSPSIEEEEECIVCCTTMALETALSLNCQHVFCKTCLEQISKSGTAVCPTCREPFESDLHGTEYVQFTATQQWDELLEIAQDWARLDRHGKDDEPEDTEEEELPFIEEDLDESSPESETELPIYDRNNSEESVPRSLRRRRHISISTPPPDDDQDGSAPISITPSLRPERSMTYHESPRAEKRRRLAQLAEVRGRRRRNW